MTGWQGQRRAWAQGRLKTGERNRSEADYEAYLRQRARAGEVLWYRFEGLKLRLADSTFYTPDFALMLADGSLEVHEVKGFWEDDARVKVKVAAEMYPFRFVAVTKRAKKHGGGYTFEQFGSAGEKPVPQPQQAGLALPRPETEECPFP